MDDSVYKTLFRLDDVRFSSSPLAQGLGVPSFGVSDPPKKKKCSDKTSPETGKEKKARTEKWGNGEGNTDGRFHRRRYECHFPVGTEFDELIRFSSSAVCFFKQEISVETEDSDVSSRDDSDSLSIEFSNASVSNSSHNLDARHVDISALF